MPEWGEAFLNWTAAEGVAREALRTRQQSRFRTNRSTFNIILPSPDNGEPGGRLEITIWTGDNGASVRVYLRGATHSNHAHFGNATCSYAYQSYEDKERRLAGALRRGVAEAVLSARRHYIRVENYNQRQAEAAANAEQ